VGFVVDEVALEQGFSECFGFPCQFSFHRLLHIHHLSSGASTMGQLVANVPSGLKSQSTLRKKNLQTLSVHQVWHFEGYDQTILNVLASGQYIWWCIDPLLSSDSVNSGYC
jgi:hypothetical protein